VHSVLSAEGVLPHKDDMCEDQAVQHVAKIVMYWSTIDHSSSRNMMTAQNVDRTVDVKCKGVQADLIYTI
jgi:hypothetical protein